MNEYLKRAGVLTPRKPRHECEEWQMQELAKGGRYCAACGVAEAATEIRGTAGGQDQ